VYLIRWARTSGRRCAMITPELALAIYHADRKRWSWYLRVVAAGRSAAERSRNWSARCAALEDSTISSNPRRRTSHAPRHNAAARGTPDRAQPGHPRHERRPSLKRTSRPPTTNRLDACPECGNADITFLDGRRACFSR
jgi:hypothetical protein